MGKNTEVDRVEFVCMESGDRRETVILGEMDPSEAEGILPRRCEVASCGVDGADEDATMGLKSALVAEMGKE
ncbi:hypothetical protein CCR75_008958 [Bremia lactucae]|uniref:Uncharacterized protein n=1 Tax=Bremia lactucae TaxID=4779 RepID=A0A976FMR6_BRELC|nr:hypothetical protein CCR75_008958 [Bremia lactucae]